MTRKDSEKDADRPHYYSQFWLDIAAGRRVIGGPRPEDEADEAEIPELTSVPTRKAGRNSTADGHKDTHAAAVVAPVIDEEEEIIEPEDEELEQEDMVEEAEIPNIALDEVEQEAQEPAEEGPVEEEEETFDEDDEEEEEEEDDEEWGRRGGRKKAKPTRPVKPVKKPKPRRGF